VQLIDDPAHQGRPRRNMPISRAELLRAVEKLLANRSPPWLLDYPRVHYQLNNALPTPKLRDNGGALGSSDH
jgi:hypothetical protein